MIIIININIISMLVIIFIDKVLYAFGHGGHATANLRTQTMDFTGFDSSIILFLRGGIPSPIGKFPECLGQAILVGIILVGRLRVIQF